MEVLCAVVTPDEGRFLPAPPIAPARVRSLCLLALLGIGVWLARTGWVHISQGHPDFEYFYKGGTWLLIHGSLDPGYDVVDGRVERRGALDWYWPFVHRVMTLFALLPQRLAGGVWLALNLAAALATIRLVGRNLMGLPPRDWPVTQLLPFLILTAYWLWEFQLNQINNFTLLLVVGSFVCWQAGRNVGAGFWLGLAVLLKLTPGLLVLWFVLKRQYRTAAAAVLTVGLAGPVSDLAALGWSQTAESYRAWAERSVTIGSHRGLILAQREMDWRNQGFGAVMSRWLHPTNYNTHFDNDPRVQAVFRGYEPRTLNVANLTRPTVAKIVMGIVGGTLAGLIWLARRPASALTLWQLRFEWALFVLAMLWLMPVMRRYHMIWALPALSLLAGGVHYSGPRSRWSKLALACIGLMLVAQLALPTNWLEEVGLVGLSALAQRVEASGVILASVVALAVPLITMLRRLSRRPEALPEPFYALPHPAQGAVAAAASKRTPSPVIAHV